MGTGRRAREVRGESEAEAQARAQGSTGATSEPAAAMLQLQRIVGNRTVVRRASAARGVAERGVRGPGHAMPHGERIQRSFGDHDISGIRAHTGAAAAAAARAIGADAYATGPDVAFASAAPGLFVAAHEAAHVVQQRAGVRLAGGVGAVGDRHERHADAVAERVVRGRSAADLLASYAGGAGGGGPPVVQRHAFIRGTQVDAEDEALTEPMREMVLDDEVRLYEDMPEFRRHAEGQTDYIGNEARYGTWLRFHRDGINLLGEDHTVLTAMDMIPAVGSTRFIHEPFTPEDLEHTPNLKDSYEAENAARFEIFGVDRAPDKRAYGAELLLPKMGYGLTRVKDDLNEDDWKGLREGKGYIGQPGQRYLKMAWAFSKDNLLAEADNVLEDRASSPKRKALADFHLEHSAVLDDFIDPLVIDGYLGDALRPLGKPERNELMGVLRGFITAFSDVVVEEAAADPSSRLSHARRQELGARTDSLPDDEKIEMFYAWRDYCFEDTVAAAIQNGVRYAGMGGDHLEHLKKFQLPDSVHPYAMDGDGEDLKRMRRVTEFLRSKLKPT